MNKREISEIKKLFSPANCAISRICGCYVDAEKDRRMEVKGAFLSLPETETFKYFTIFRGALSGTIGKNMINMSFPLATEEIGGTQDFLLNLRDSGLKNEVLVEKFYDKVIASYDYGENYYIILIHCIYDIPGKGTDGQDLDDASDYVYDFIQCVICPVKLSKAGLYYNTEANMIENRNRDWLVEAPDTGFIFPAFNDRSTDIHSLLFYTKNPEQMPERLINETLGCVMPMSAKDQAQTFQGIVEEVLGDGCTFEVVKNIHDNLCELAEESKDESEQFIIDKDQLKGMLEGNGASEEKLKDFESRYNDIGGQQPELLITNVANQKSFEIKTPDVSIRVKADKTHLVETRIIDGRTCVVIGFNENVEVNGIKVIMGQVSSMKETKE
ncbi:protein of unknown function [Lacrimispora sphenoides]|uniref:DUF4317 domain-containing protein n=1 Tax=Lacrimispora sphenoides TaxID=29370 RepID=UPI0008B64DAA|nr:DUF4317 domain-containing protein [Lacrimispora sphenoides]SEU24190.1 protein of unknown function [Lacrimispora sphenoides]